MTMLRKIRRSVAKYNMQQQDIHFFKMYTTCEAKKWDKRKKKFILTDMSKSYFSRAWRGYSS